MLATAYTITVVGRDESEGSGLSEYPDHSSCLYRDGDPYCAYVSTVDGCPSRSHTDRKERRGRIDDMPRGRLNPWRDHQEQQAKIASVRENEPRKWVTERARSTSKEE